MGLFSGLVRGFKEVNDDLHGQRLLEEANSTFRSMERLSNELQGVALLGFLEIRRGLLSEMPNWSREGRIEIGRAMQLQARETFHLDMSGSYAKWLSGAWLESQSRESMKAEMAFRLIEGLRSQVESHLISGSAK